MITIALLSFSAPMPCRRLLFCCLLFISGSVFSQKLVLDRDPAGHYRSCTTRRHIFKMFRLQPQARQRYALDLWEDSTGLLLRQHRGHWLVLDTLAHSVGFLPPWGDTVRCAIGYPAFVIRDFNRDGYPDLVATVSTNVQGNAWTKLFLYDAGKGLLTSLQSLEEGIWANPRYEARDSTIRCAAIGSNSGGSYSSSYKLRGLIPIPLTMTREVEAGRRCFYIGKKGRWQVTSCEK